MFVNNCFELTNDFNTCTCILKSGWVYFDHRFQLNTKVQKIMMNSYMYINSPMIVTSVQI